MDKKKVMKRKYDSEGKLIETSHDITSTSREIDNINRDILNHIQESGELLQKKLKRNYERILIEKHILFLQRVVRQLGRISQKCKDMHKR